MGRRFRNSIRTGGLLTKSPRPRRSDPKLDLHGLRAHMGEAHLADFMREQIANGEKVVTVIHGHGTGVMREIVYAWIHDHRHLIADTHDFGPGVTIFLR